ncbi:hypothetical protein KKE54_09035, partial [bacterium]|nr:hypothetical protein [bacterium]
MITFIRNLRNSSFRSLFFIFAVVLVLSFASCGGGGGGDVVEDDNGDFTGGTGTGANGVVTFWHYYTAREGYFGSAKAVLETAGDGFVLAGEQGVGFLPADHDIRLVKTDSSGTSLMQKSIELPGGSVAKDIVETADGDFTAVGSRGSDAERDLVLFSTDAAFSQKWLKTFDGGVGSDEGDALLKTEGGYLMVGSSLRSEDPLQQDIWLLQSDENGTQDSEHLYGGPGGNAGHDVIATSDGGYAVAGIGVPDGGGDGHLHAYLVKTDASGNELWHRSYGIGLIYSLQQTADDGYVMTGINAPWEGEPHSANDLLVIKTDAAGNEEWRRTFGGSDIDVGKKVLIDGNGDYIIVGTTQSFTSGEFDYQRQDLYIIKLDAEGNTIWQKVKGINGSSDYAETAALTSDGGFIVAGSGNGQIMAAKFDANGDTITLGDKDFTLTVPETLTAINYANATDIAGNSIKALTLPQNVGTFALQRYIDALNGVPTSDFCDVNGTYSWSAPLSSAPAAGETNTLTLNACVSGSGIDQLTFDGNTTLIFNRDTTGDLSSTAYDVNVTLNDINITYTDSIGLIAIEGATQFTRNAAGGTFTEISQQAPSPLTYTESNSTVTLSQYLFNDTVTSTAYSIGQNGNSALFSVTGFSGTLALA